MQYILLIYDNEHNQLPPDERSKMFQEYGAFTQGIIKSGNFKAGDPLQPTSTATTVRVRDGKTLTVDGPFAETKEQLAGYYMLECKDLDDAIEWAKRIPTGCKGAVGCIEIRPVHELSRRP